VLLVFPCPPGFFYKTCVHGEYTGVESGMVVSRLTPDSAFLPGLSQTSLFIFFFRSKGGCFGRSDRRTGLD
jgi:hypothetical protein